MSNLVKNLLTLDNGNIAVVTAVIAPLLIGGGGIGLDYANYYSHRSALQEAADAAALSSTKELTVTSSTDSLIESIAKQYATVNFFRNRDAKVTELQVDATVNDQRNSVTVELAYHWRPILSNVLGTQITPITIVATATLAGETPVCVIGLDPNSEKTVSLDSNARLTAKNCSVNSNSVHSNGLVSQSNAIIDSAATCSAGGAKGGSKNFKPNPLTDCPVVPDPLISRPAPGYDGCTFNNMKIVDQKKALNPGVYCGGLTIDGNSEITFGSGIYVIKNGMLNVDSNSIVKGEHVGFYFTGKNAGFRFASNARVNFSAPRSGEMAGLLFFGDRNSPSTQTFEILSNYARNMVGTIYLPNGHFLIDADNPVADQSAYTAIVAKRIELYSGPNLVLNTDYSLTDIPVPEGIRTNSQVRLIK